MLHAVQTSATNTSDTFTNAYCLPDHSAVCSCNLLIQNQCSSDEWKVRKRPIKLFFCGPLPFINITIAPVLCMQQRVIIDPLWYLSSGCSLTATSAGRTHRVKFKHLLDKRFSISQGGEDSCCDRLGYDPVKSCSWLTFRRNILPLSSGLKALLNMTVKNRIYRPSWK